MKRTVGNLGKISSGERKYFQFLTGLQTHQMQKPLQLPCLQVTPQIEHIQIHVLRLNWHYLNM